MFEQLARLLLLPGGLAGLGSLGLAGSAARLLGNAVAEFLAGCGQGNPAVSRWTTESRAEALVPSEP